MFYCTAHGLECEPPLSDIWKGASQLREPREEWSERMPAQPADISCRLFTEYASDYIEGTLTARQTRQLEHHVQKCLGCRNYLRQMQLTIQSLRELEELSPSPHLRRKLIKQFRTWKAKRDN